MQLHTKNVRHFCCHISAGKQIACSFLLGFCFNFNAYANVQSSQSALLDMSLAQLLQIPVRSSTLTDENTRSAPAALTLYTHTQIEQLGVDYLHELMNLVPGFQSFRQEESADEYYHSVRGHRSSTSSREVLILIDGQRFNREFDNAINVPMIALANVEKIEFIRGPGSAIYGSNAFSGVVSITTRQGASEAQVQVGDNNHLRAQVLNTFQANGFQIDIYLNAYNDNEGNQYLLQDYSTGGLYPAKEKRTGYDLNLKIKGESTRLDLVHMNRGTEGFYALEAISDQNTTQNTYSSLGLEKDFAWQQVQSSAQVRLFKSSYGTEALDPYLGFAWFEQQEKGADIKFHNSWQYAESANLSFGLEYRRTLIAEVNYSSANYGSDLLYDDEDRKVYGVYLQNQWQLLESTELTLGARVDGYSGLKTSVSPRFGVVHNLTPIHTLKLLYGEAFRAPTTNEMHIRNLYGLLAIAGNSTLEPETIKTWELQWQGNWPKYSVSATLFNQNIENSIYRDSTSNPNSFKNLQDSESSQGLELEYTIDLAENLRLRGNYSWFDNLSTTDYQQADRLAAIALNYQKNNCNANLSAAYAGEREFTAFDQQQTIPSYWELNSKVQWQFSATTLFYLQAKNLTDNNYQTPVRRSNLTIPVPNRGREISLGLKYQF